MTYETMKTYETIGVDPLDLNIEPLGKKNILLMIHITELQWWFFKEGQVNPNRAGLLDIAWERGEAESARTF